MSYLSYVCDSGLELICSFWLVLNEGGFYYVGIIIHNKIMSTYYSKILYAKYIIAAIKSPGLELIIYLDDYGNILNQI